MTVQRGWLTGLQGNIVLQVVDSWIAYDLNGVVTWTLTPTGTGTRLRMEQ